jgi:hypothetical protein
MIFGFARSNIYDELGELIRVSGTLCHAPSMPQSSNGKPRPPSGMDCRSVPGRLEWMGSGGVISANDSSVKNWKEKEALLPRGGD